MYTRPSDSVSSPARQCISVDLPEPDGPMIAVNRLRSNETVTPSSARISVSPSPYSFTASMAPAAAVWVIVSAAPLMVPSSLAATCCTGARAYRAGSTVAGAGTVSLSFRLRRLGSSDRLRLGLERRPHPCGQRRHAADGPPCPQAWHIGADGYGPGANSRRRFSVVAEADRRDAADRRAADHQRRVGDGRARQGVERLQRPAQPQVLAAGAGLGGRLVPAHQGLGGGHDRQAPGQHLADDPFAGRGQGVVAPFATERPDGLEQVPPHRERTGRKQASTPLVAGARRGRRETIVAEPSAWTCSPPQLTSTAPVARSDVRSGPASRGRPRRRGRAARSSARASARPRTVGAASRPAASWRTMRTRPSATARAAATLSSLEPSSTTTTSTSAKVCASTLGHRASDDIGPITDGDHHTEAWTHAQVTDHRQGECGGCHAVATARGSGRGAHQERRHVAVRGARARGRAVPGAAPASRGGRTRAARRSRPGTRASRRASR